MSLGATFLAEVSVGWCGLCLSLSFSLSLFPGPSWRGMQGKLQGDVTSRLPAVRPSLAL
jgi:hypothetical protein